MRALVVGGTGYLGLNLIKTLLARGYSVCSISRQPHACTVADSLRGAGATFIEADVTKPDTLNRVAEGVDVVYHLVSSSHGDRYFMDDINIEGTRNVLSECSTRSLRLVYASTTSVYGNPGSDRVVDEKVRPMPNTAYGKAKLAAEDLVLASGFGVVVRFGTVYGPGSPVTSDYIKKEGKLRVIGSGRNYNNVLHINDAVEVLIACSVRSEPGSIYIATDGHPVQPREFYKCMAVSSGVAASVKFVGSIRLRLLTSVFTLLGKLTSVPPVLSLDTVKLLTNSIRADSSSLAAELGVSFLYPDYTSGLDATFAAPAPAPEAIAKTREEGKPL